MARAPRAEDVLAVLRREVAESRYAHAPGRISFSGVYAQLAIGGFRRSAATEAALRQVLGDLVAAGQVRPAEVTAPDGTTVGGWYELAVEPSLAERDVER